MDLHACHLLQNIYNCQGNSKLGGEKAFSNKPRKLGVFLSVPFVADISQFCSVKRK